MIEKRNIFLLTSVIAAAVPFLHLFAGGCRGTAPSPTEIHLFCGAALRLPLSGNEAEEGVLGRFQSSYPDITVRTTFGASNLLLGQLKLARSGDLFFPGDEFYIKEAGKEGMVHDSRTVALFVPVIMVQCGNPLGVESVSDLAEPHVRLAAADMRAAAIGRITPDIFAVNGIDFGGLDNIVFTGITAHEIAQAVALGHADATIVWRPVAKQYPGSDTVVEIAPEMNIVSPLVIAVLETSENKEAAIRFADFISGPAGREVFKMYHYAPYDYETDKRQKQDG